MLLYQLENETSPDVANVCICINLRLSTIVVRVGFKKIYRIDVTCFTDRDMSRRAIIKLNKYKHPKGCIGMLESGAL